MQNIALSHTNHLWLSPPTTTMGSVTPWFIISPKDVQKTCSKWMLRKFWKLQVVDLNQTSRRLHKYLNMFETIITQEIPLKKVSASLFSCPGQEDSRFYIEWSKLWLQGYHKIMELFGCGLYHLSCSQWCDYVTFEHLKSSVVCGWMVWATVESQNSGELFTGMCNKRFHVQLLSEEEENFFFFSVLAKKTSDVRPVLLSRQYCNVHAYIAASLQCGCGPVPHRRFHFCSAWDDMSSALGHYNMVKEQNYSTKQQIVVLFYAVRRLANIA